MTKFISVIVLQAASCASILGLYFTLTPATGDRPWWHWSLLTFVVGVSIFLIVQEIIDHQRSAPRVYRSQRRINSFMRRWVSSGGRVVIFSRDMSWAQEQPIRQLLLEKAECNELTVCVEHSIPLTDELDRRGARIIPYGVLGHVPRSRFTIVGFDREGALVAIGGKVRDVHMIQQFSNGHHPCFALAEDLVKILIGFSDLGPHVSQN
jgi:hypothetical protein